MVYFSATNIHNMKPILAILISFLSLSAMAQGTAPKQGTSANCFKEWYSLFKERGGNPVPDGTQDVVITVRGTDYSECFMGKIDVAGGKIVPKSLQIQKVDGSYEEYDKKLGSAFQNNEGVLKEELRDVANGMSAAVNLADGENVRLFFYKFLADKPKANKKAPAPSALVKN
jgi:hypothetical protein